MNYKAMVRGALALSLGLMVGVASAADTQVYGATFENEINTTVGELNDHIYTNNMPITDSTLHDESTGTGWFSGDAEGDESKIITRTDAAGGQALQLNTDASTLTNKFSSTVKNNLNTTLETKGITYYETEVKFVASDTLDAGITGGQDNAKFAIYAYSDEEAETVTTNLVVYHGVMNSGTGAISYTNEVFTSVTIDTEVYTPIRIEMKILTDPGEDPEDTTDDTDYNAFSVTVGGTTLSSDTAYDCILNGTATGSWFLTVENRNEGTDMQVSALTFKGTGEIDNIDVGVVETTYAVNWTGSANVVVTNGAEEVSGTSGSYAANTVLTFYPTEGAITNVAGTAVDNLASFQLTVTQATNIVVLAGTAPAASDDYEADDDVGGTTLSAAMATWLNGLKDAKGMTKDAYTAAIAADTDAYSLTEEYLLNTDPTVNTTVEFKISSIAVGSTVDVQVTLTRTESAAVTSAINGTLKIYGAATVNGTYAEDQSLTDKFNGVTTATKSFSTENKFFKAVIE